MASKDKNPAVSELQIQGTELGLTGQQLEDWVVTQYTLVLAEERAERAAKREYDKTKLDFDRETQAEQFRALEYEREIIKQREQQQFEIAKLTNLMLLPRAKEIKPQNWPNLSVKLNWNYKIGLIPPLLLKFSPLQILKIVTTWMFTLTVLKFLLRIVGGKRIFGAWHLVVN